MFAMITELIGDRAKARERGYMYAMAGETEISFLPGETRQPPAAPVSAPPSRFHSSQIAPWSTPRSFSSPSRFLTPLASPSVTECLEEIDHLTPQDPVAPADAWLPITESREGNACYAAFHALCSGIGFQALLLPVAFAALGWVWGIICLVVVFFWQLYTLWLLTRLHEVVPGTRYSRYLHLCMVYFGERLGKWLAKFPVMYLSGGTCTTLIIMGGGSIKLFYHIVDDSAANHSPLTGIEWYLVFVCIAVIVAQLPNLNSIAGVSLVGAVTAVGYCTLLWALSVAKGPVAGVSYGPKAESTEVGKVLGVLNGIGIIVFAFRGHNLIVEIQGTIPSTPKHPSHVPMWRGVRIAYALIAMCLFPVAIGGYWAYGNMIPRNGILAAIHAFHGRDTSKAILGLTTLLVVISCLSSFPIYAMPVFDTLEFAYVSKRNGPCPRWVRSAIRVFFGSLTFFIAVAFPFLPDLAGLLGGVALPVTMAYPCFMWVVAKKPRRFSPMWFLNWGLGLLGMTLSFVLVVSGMWSLVNRHLKVRFFRARG